MKNVMEDWKIIRMTFSCIYAFVILTLRKKEKMTILPHVTVVVFTMMMIIDGCHVCKGTST
ncbi:hypothetical protein BDA99DRAFT_517339 [Phascolomyces articulosus]|uniref:Uncharacterized protein n=1 Tax=Phascolomyces articulosus TaxID=60185 RepID=A0AAD5JV17_9FUNG|nr:hypothetical protein BDA99DRAFT_517339 [Phascolomyces articulosus]